MRHLKNILEEKKYSKIIYYSLLVILAVLPLHAFLMMSLRHFLNAPFWLNAWKDILIFFLFLLFLAKILKEKKIPFKITILDKFIIGFFIASLISVLVNKVSFIQAVWGAKYDLEFLALFLIARSASFSKEAIKNSLKIFFISLFIVSFFGVFQIFFLPKDFLVNFGYSEIEARAGHSVDRQGKIPAIWNDFGIPRAFSFFSGPNNFGYFLTIGIIFLILLITFKLYEKRNLKILYLIFVSALIALAYSHSRSSWLGFAIALIVGFFIINWVKSCDKIFLKRFGVLACFSFLIMFLFLSLNFNLFDKKDFQLVFLHGSYTKEGEMIGSTVAHMEDYQKFDFWKENFSEQIFGIGMGKVNAAAVKFPQGRSVESWYLQILWETGIFGLMCFIGIIGSFLFLLLKFFTIKNDYFIFSISLSIFLGMTTMSVASFFIPAWFDSSNTLVFWTLSGLIFSYIFKSIPLKYNLQQK